MGYASTAVHLCNIMGMYRKLADAIRAVDAVHLILFQGVTWEVVLPIGEKCACCCCTHT